MSEPTSSVRPGSNAYIDEAGLEPLEDLQIVDDGSDSSGSSVEEEIESEGGLPAVPPSVNGENEAPKQRLEDFAHLDERRQVSESDAYSDESDWDVDDEDWELANGDFTKQYNRLRQQHNAQTPQAGPSSSRLDTRPTAPARAPLPARNANVAKDSGVALNPKSVSRATTKDKSDRATQEQVLDPRTRLALSGLVNRGIVGEIERCISTGKEANVYHAQISDNAPPHIASKPSLAVKIYRTSILSFRARQAYIVGEHRFKGEYSSSRNARKMVKVWAEKELRNLRRLEQAGIRAPRVIEGKENVLVMEFLGVDDTAAPRLKDADVPEEELPGLYVELVVAVRKMYQQCKLVHGDLSEYNILYHDSHIYIIDVSQSVEHDHPKAFEFLRIDIRNVEDFFKKKSGGELATLGPRRTWEFIVSESVGLAPQEEIGDEGEERLAAIVRERLEEERDETDDAVFMSSFIPRNLGEVYDPERDVDLVKAGRGDELIYSTLTGVLGRSTKETSGTGSGSASTTRDDKEQVAAEADPATGADEHDGDADRNEDDDDENEYDTSKPRGFRNEDKDAKKERKQAVKEAKREQRQHKMPKAEKKRLIKKSAG